MELIRLCGALHSRSNSILQRPGAMDESVNSSTECKRASSGSSSDSYPSPEISPTSWLADADLLAVPRRTPSSRFDVVSTTLSASFGPCALSQRHLRALATKVGEISGLGAQCLWHRALCHRASGWHGTTRVRRLGMDDAHWAVLGRDGERKGHRGESPAPPRIVDS